MIGDTQPKCENNDDEKKTEEVYEIPHKLPLFSVYKVIWEIL